MTTENQSILTQRHGVESLPAAWRNTFEMHGLEWDAGYNAARIACADELAATLTQQQGGEQEATCAGCNGRGEVGGWAGDGYQTDPCPFCTPSGLPDALTGDFDCPKAAECRACPCGFCTALRSKQPAASEGDGQGIDDRALDAALMAARNATWDIGEDASHSSAEKIALAVLAALRTPASEGDGGRVVGYANRNEFAAEGSAGFTCSKRPPLTDSSFFTIPLYTTTPPTQQDARAVDDTARLDWLSRSSNLQNEIVQHGYGSLRHRIDAALAAPRAGDTAQDSGQG